jgi:hypothetical protein
MTRFRNWLARRISRLAGWLLERSYDCSRIADRLIVCEFCGQALNTPPCHAASEQEPQEMPF